MSFAFRDVSFGTVKPWKSQHHLILDVGSVYSLVYSLVNVYINGDQWWLMMVNNEELMVINDDFTYPLAKCHTKLWKDPPFFIGKSTMLIFQRV